MFANPFKLKKLGILGMNKRNIHYIGGQNDRKYYPLVDNKLKTKVIAEDAGIAVPTLLATIEHHSQLRKLKELLAICEALKELWISGDKNAFQEYAEQVLPTQEGFFFGNQEYGEYYMYDIDETINILTDLDFDESDYYYQSSW